MTNMTTKAPERTILSEEIKMKPLENFLKKKQSVDALFEKIKKDKKAVKLIKKISSNKKLFDYVDLQTILMRYIANGLYEKDFPGTYKEWARMWYREWYLSCTHWINFRKSILAKHDGRCELCEKDNQQLDIHHRTYENLFFEKREDVLIICRGCHSKIHPD